MLTVASCMDDKPSRRQEFPEAHSGIGIIIY